MRRLLRVALVGYLALAVLGHVREKSGEISCACRDDCWCKKPGLNLFRWVFPVGHSLR